jgi:hypothetical protein
MDCMYLCDVRLRTSAELCKAVTLFGDEYTRGIGSKSITIFNFLKIKKIMLTVQKSYNILVLFEIGNVHLELRNVMSIWQWIFT